MNAYKKLVIQALTVLIFVILIYNEWTNMEACYFYVEALGLSEMLVEFAYLYFNRKTITESEKSKETVAILIFAIVVVGTYLLSLLRTN